MTYEKPKVPTDAEFAKILRGTPKDNRAPLILSRAIGKLAGVDEAWVKVEWANRWSVTVLGRFKKDPKDAINEHLASLGMAGISWGGMTAGHLSHCFGSEVITGRFENFILPWTPPPVPAKRRKGAK